METLERPVDLPERDMQSREKATPEPESSDIPTAMEALILEPKNGRTEADPGEMAVQQTVPVHGASIFQALEAADGEAGAQAPEEEAPADQTSESGEAAHGLENAEEAPDSQVLEAVGGEADFSEAENSGTEPELEDIIVPGGKRRRIRPEWIMVGVAFLAAAALGITAALSTPFIHQDEDPMELPSYHMAATEPEETFLEPTVSQTEPENPTIPPDRNPYDRFDFQYDKNNYLLLQNVVSYPGVDVSAYQGNIDWHRVAASGIRFAIVRLGYRGYGSGKLVEDEYAKRNLDGASGAGLQVGAYFFSQALNEKEVDEEIDFMLNILGEQYLAMPIILDWEIPTADARTAGKMDARSLTDLQLYFCQKMKERGYQPMVYFNWHQSEELYLLSELEEYPFWLALYQDRMTYPWKVEMWQYSCTGTVPGIDGDVDLNVYMP